MDDATYTAIDALMSEAGAAGDSDMCRLARRALEDEDAEAVRLRQGRGTSLVAERLVGEWR